MNIYEIQLNYIKSFIGRKIFMKKGIDTILIAILIIACPLTVFGADLDTGDKNSEGIYISSETVPDEVYTYAEENIGWTAICY